MPTLWNIDHQAAIIDGVAVLSGESRDFTDEEVEGGIAGQWSKADPRSGLPTEVAWKAQRDTPVIDEAQATEPEPDPVVPDAEGPVWAPGQVPAGESMIPETPAEPAETQE